MALSIADLDWKCKAGLHVYNEFIRTGSVVFRFVCYEELNEETDLFHPFSTSRKIVTNSRRRGGRRGLIRGCSAHLANNLAHPEDSPLGFGELWAAIASQDSAHKLQ